MNYTFNKETACKYGVEEAILINHFQWWIAKNKANKKNEFDGHFWTYNTIEALHLLFPFWTEKQIRRILKSMIKQGILITGNYNKSSYDRTLWYAFKDESIFLNGKIDLSKRENGKDQMGAPIPVILPEELPVILPEVNTAPQAVTDELIFPFESDNFRSQWNIWKQYKKDQHRFKYKSIMTEQAALKHLCDLAGGLEETAINIIHQSIGNSWKGFFQLQQNSSKPTHNGKFSPEEMQAAAARYFSK